MTEETRSTGEGFAARDTMKWAALTLFSVLIMMLAAAPVVWMRPTARQFREQLLAEVQPVVLRNCDLQRFGSRNDGGYLMCGNLLGGIQAAYSYGIGGRDDWGCHVSDAYGVTVHQYDCFSPPDQACPGRRSVFHDECIGAEASIVEARVFDTLTGQIAKNGDAGKTLGVKIDVEGAELPSLVATPDRVLDRIDQLAMEIHGADRHFLRLVRKLKRTFYVVHLHYNNQACSTVFHPLRAWAYQVLLVNKRIGVLDPTAPPPQLPHPLDAPDYPPRRECEAVSQEF